MRRSVFLLDLDGTLVDSEPLKGLALAETCGLYGSPVDFSIYAEVMGSDWTTVLAHFFHAAGVRPDSDEFTAKFRTRYVDLLEEKLQPTVGVTKFLEHAAARNVRLALVSSAAPWMVDKVLALTSLRHLFEITISQADVMRHKPDPEAYLLALKRLGAEATDCIVFEDSTPGLLAAHGAGCRSIAIRHAFNQRHDFSLADKEIGSFYELGDSFFSSKGD